jgi:hypothetical protein
MLILCMIISLILVAIACLVFSWRTTKSVTFVTIYALYSILLILAEVWFVTSL